MVSSLREFFLCSSGGNSHKNESCGVFPIPFFLEIGSPIEYYSCVLFLRNLNSFLLYCVGCDDLLKSLTICFCYVFPRKCNTHNFSNWFSYFFTRKGIKNTLAWTMKYKKKKRKISERLRNLYFYVVFLQDVFFHEYWLILSELCGTTRLLSFVDIKLAFWRCPNRSTFLQSNQK